MSITDRQRRIVKELQDMSEGEKEMLAFSVYSIFSTTDAWRWLVDKIKEYHQNPDSISKHDLTRKVIEGRWE